MNKILSFSFCFLLSFLVTGCCSSGIKKDWFSHEVEIAPIKSFVADGGFEAGDYFSEKYKRLSPGRDEDTSYLDIRGFEFQWGVTYKAVLRGYAEVDCGMKDAPTHIRYYQVEKIISEKAAQIGSCFGDNLPKLYDFGNHALYSNWVDAFAKLKIQLSESDAIKIKNNIGRHAISYQICFLGEGHSTIKIQNVVVQP